MSIKIKRYPSNLEPETYNALYSMIVQPSLQEVVDYDDLIKSIKTGQSLTLGVNNLGSKFRVLYVNCAHDKEVTRINWANTSTGFKNFIGNVLFTSFVGIKSDGSSYCLLNDRYPSNNLETPIYFGYYLVDDVNTGTALGDRNDNLNRGWRGQLNSSNTGKYGRTATVSNGTKSGQKRHVTVRRVTDSSNSIGELYIDGVLVNTGNTDSNYPTLNTHWYELVYNFDDTNFTDQCTGNIAFSYKTIGGVSINMSNLHTSLKNYLTNKGITGL